MFEHDPYVQFDPTAARIRAKHPSAQRAAVLRASDGRSAQFGCLECGKKFRTAGAAERAANNGCPKCGGVDIDLV